MRQRVLGFVFGFSLFLMSVLCCSGQAAAVIQFSSSHYSIPENAGTALITVVRSGDLLAEAAVEYRTADGSAKAGVHYAASSGTLTFTPGQTNQQITVAILDNSAPDGDKALQLLLSNPTGGASLGARTNATLTIRDNEVWVPPLDIAFSPAISGGISVAARQDDGRLIVAGGLCLPGEGCSPQVIRLLSDGSRDSGFKAPQPGSTRQGYQATFSALALQPDGKVLVAGNFTNLDAMAVSGLARLNRDGSIDATFNTAGGIADTNGGPGVQGLAVQPDGKILVGGTFNRVNGVARSYLARLNQDGSLDTNFTTRVNDQVTQISPQTDGSVFLGGYFHSVNNTVRYHLAKLLPNGALDTNFVPHTSMSGLVSVLAVQPDGKVVIGGITRAGPDALSAPTDGGPRRGLTHLESDGSVDPSFNPVMDVPCTWAAALQSDGKIIVGGCFNQINGMSVPGLARLNPDGSPDPSFAPVDNGNRNISVLALQPDGRLLVGGNDGTLIRLNSNGSVDPSFSVGTPPVGSLTQALLQSDGRLLLAGNFTSFNGSARTNMVRLNGDAFLTNAVAQFRAIRRLPTGPLQLTIDTIPGRQLTVESSVDLVNWNLLSTLHPTNYSQPFLDSSVESELRRFYRARRDR